MNIGTKIVYKILANRTEQYIKRMTKLGLLDIKFDLTIKS